jgi:fatty-acyl-CoA synthase
MMARDQVYIHRLLRELQRLGPAAVLRYRSLNYSGDMLRALIFQYARVLRDMDVSRGKLLAMFAPNCPEALALRYAAHIQGAAAVYLAIPATASERRNLIEQMEPDLLVVFPETDGCLDQESAVPFATVGFDRAGSLGRLDALAAAASIEPMPVMANAADLAVVASSGGSTGVPKGSCRSFAVYSALVDAPSPADRIQLINGPLAYLSQVLVDITLLGGGRVVLRDGYEASDTLATIETEKVTNLFLVEPQLFELMDDHEIESYDLSSLRCLTHIGASAPASLRLRARAHFGTIIEHAYGASEMGLVSVLAPCDHDLLLPELFASAGRIRPGVEVRFRTPDGRLACQGEIGVIEVRSPVMSTGYRGNPDLTARAYRAGWYVTGDLGRLDDEGLLHILGRAVDVQDLDGTLVTPTGIEEALCGIHSVRYAVVVRDPEAGLTIAAVITWEGLSIDNRECRQIIADRFGNAAAASLVVVQVKHIPLTEQGKPDRAAIRALAHGSLAA